MNFIFKSLSFKGLLKILKIFIKFRGCDGIQMTNMLLIPFLLFPFRYEVITLYRGMEEREGKKGGESFYSNRKGKRTSSL